MYPSEKIRITPMMVNFSTAAATSLLAKTRYLGGDVSVVCGVLAGTVSTGQTATAACAYTFSLLESTAATAGGSAVSGATMTLGAATALTSRGNVSLICKVASDLATTVGLTLNGITYSGASAGATAKNGAAVLAELINGESTIASAIAKGKLPHYTAIADFSSANLLLITGDDDLGTGITAVATSGGVQIFQNHLQGVIDVQGSKLSTNSPKYLGVACATFTGDTAVRMAHLIQYPTGGPATPGVKVSCTT